MLTFEGKLGFLGALSRDSGFGLLQSRHGGSQSSISQIFRELTSLLVPLCQTWSIAWFSLCFIILMASTSLIPDQ